jgi:hypothetical protein
VILNDSISVVVIVVCIVWCRLFICMVLGFFLGRMVMYLCMSHSISFSKLWDGGCKSKLWCVWLLWEN